MRNLWIDAQPLVYASRMAAKVDSAAHEAICSDVRGTATRQKKGRRESRPFEGSHRERKPALYLMNSISR